MFKVSLTKLTQHLPHPSIPGVLFLLAITILALSICVNQFQEWYFAEDMLSAVLSVVSLPILLHLHCSFPISMYTINVNRRTVHLATYILLTILWFAADIFSTIKWVWVPLHCSRAETHLIERWCIQINALRGLMWIMLFARMSSSLSVLCLCSINGIVTSAAIRAWIYPRSLNDNYKLFDRVDLETSSC